LKTTAETKPFKVFSTFSGIGGFEVGIDHAAALNGFEVEHVGYSEVDKYAISVYENHFKGVKNYGDITKIEAESLPNFDCLVGGFPCQAFSIAGRRGGFKDTRGTLFFDLARILRAKQPRLFVFENVKGLLNHDGGRTFRTIITTIAELGYDCQWQVLNSKDFGVPQNRERIIIIGHLRGTPRPQVFPITQSSQRNDRAPEPQGELPGSRQYTGAIDANYYKGPDGKRTLLKVGTLRTHNDGNGFREMKSGLAPTIPVRARNDGSGQPVILQRPRGKNQGNTHDIAPSITGKSYQDNNHLMVQSVQTPDRSNKKQNGRQIKPDGEPSHTLTSTDRHGVLISKTVRAGGRNSPHGAKQNWDSYEVDGVIRRLTPMECERLQAFPDNWTANGVDHERGMIVPVSDTQRYKMCGNAVTTNVIQAVFERIFANG